MATKNKDGPVAGSVEMSKCRVTLQLLGMAIEVQRGAMVTTREHDDGDGVAFIQVNATLGEKAPTTKAVILNGELYISALDAGAASVRERSRLLAVARRASNA